MTHRPDEPGVEPAATAEVRCLSTEHLPNQTPFRVEPATPVPDDVVPPEELPHPPTPAPRPAVVTVNRGPRTGSVMLGMLTVLVAGALLAANLTDNFGAAVPVPALVGAFGGVLLLVGLTGVVAGRLRHR